jgi:LysM repeat protein
MATACFQTLNDAENPNAVSMGLPTETFTPIPTETPTPTETLPYEPTIDPEEIALAQQTLDAQAAQDLLLSDTGGSLATETPFIFETETPAVVAQQDNFSLTATVFVAQVTQTYEASFTQTAAALGLGATATLFPTATPEAGVFPTATTPGVVAPPGTVCIHTVQIGDNLFRMGLTYGVTVNSLAAANGITNIQLIYVGQQITIPSCGTTGVFPPPTAIPTTTGGIGGPLTPTVVGQSAGVCSQHLIQEAQTLFQIALQYGVSVDSIVNANPGVITNPNIITMATTINIPCA